MLNPGELIDDKYRIVRVIGEGGMGAVYEGENARIHRRVAIKVLHADLALNAETVARFEREAQAAGRIGSEHIVEVLDLGSLASGDRYLVMEFLDGESLGQRLRRRQRLSPEEVSTLAIQLLEGLIAAHGAGIVHRDLKPDNVFLLTRHAGVTDFVKLVDFGISKFNQLSGEGGFHMTRTGAVMGTPYYMAPEQARGSTEVDHRVDLYAAGVILYESVTGCVPFHAETFNQLLFKIALEVPRPIHELAPDCDPAFAEIISRAMAREPAQRFQTAEELQKELQNWLNVRRSARPAPIATTTHVSVVEADRQLPNAGQQLGAGTGASWANTQGSPAKKRSATSVALLALAGFVVVGGGVTAALKFHSSSDANAPGGTTAESAHAAGTPQIAAASPPAAAPAPAPTPPAAAPAVAPAINSVASASPVAPAAVAAAKPGVAAGRARAAAPASPAPAPEAKPAAKEPAKAEASGNQGSGRKYRTSL
jgi:serine/threonine-protein kinase